MKKWKYAVSSAETAPDTATILLVGDAEENFENAARLGYDAVEIHTREDIGPDMIERIRRAAERNRMDISAILSGRLYSEGKCDLISDAPYITEACMRGMERYIDLAAGLGADVVIGLARGRIPAGKPRERYVSRLAGNLKALDEYAGERSVRILVEAINRYETSLLNTAEELMTFLEEYDLPNCYAQLDTFQMVTEETDPAAAVKRCGERLAYMHLADNTRLYPGSGQFDFRKLLEAMEETGYDGYLAVECLPFPGRLEAAARGLRYMKGIEKL